MRSPKEKLDTSETLGAVTGEKRVSSANCETTVALVDWSQLLEDYLDNIGVSFESFCNEMSGGWMFGYIEALKSAGIRTVLFCVSARVQSPARFRHAATGSTICVLPAPFLYRVLRRRVLNPYAATVEEAVGDVRGLRRVWWTVVKDLAAYFSTPPVHFMRELRRERCDAILCQDYEHGRFDVCLLLGRLMRLPVFASFQGNDESSGRVEKWVRRSALRASRGLIIPTRSEAQRVMAAYGVSGEKIGGILNPLNLSEWIAEEKSAARILLGIPTNARLAVWHGRIDFRRKGLDVLLEAWQIVCRQHSNRDWRLLLIGSGNNADEMRGQIAKTKPQALTWIDEYVNDRALIRRYLSAADVYVFPSRHEGFAVAPLEAMACGLPLVASDIPCVRDILEDAANSGGLIVQPDNADAFAIALKQLLEDEKLSFQMGKKARLSVEKRFSTAAVGVQLSAFLFP